jgi:hypothetical protein
MLLHSHMGTNVVSCPKYTGAGLWNEWYPDSGGCSYDVPAN